jgi:hypothetical protein
MDVDDGGKVNQRIVISANNNKVDSSNNVIQVNPNVNGYPDLNPNIIENNNNNNIENNNNNLGNNNLNNNNNIVDNNPQEFPAYNPNDFGMPFDPDVNSIF